MKKWVLSFVIALLFATQSPAITVSKIVGAAGALATFGVLD